MFLSLAMTQAAPVPPPMPQTVADCARPVYATDQLVCEDPELLSLDRQLGDLMSKIPNDLLQGKWIEEPTAWFRRSRLCAFKEDHLGCIAQAYRDRIAVLSALALPVPKPTLQCTMSHGVALSGAFSDRLLLLTGN
ncbi:MAG: hypothetical protein ABI240_16810 [Sphingomonas sp.]